jgi:hypothetical protein
MLVKNFEDLEIWKEARRLTREIYQLTKDSRFSKDFGLSRQIQRAAISIMSNIAEGFEREGNRLSVMISNLIDYLKRSGMKGAKYNGSNHSTSFNRSGGAETI